MSSSHMTGALLSACTEHGWLLDRTTTCRSFQLLSYSCERYGRASKYCSITNADVAVVRGQFTEVIEELQHVTSYNEL